MEIYYTYVECGEIFKGEEKFSEWVSEWVSWFKLDSLPLNNTGMHWGIGMLQCHVIIIAIFFEIFVDKFFTY